MLDLREPAPDGKAAAYIIDGDLDVDMVAIDARDMSTWGILVVTGDVRAKQLSCIFDGKLWVGHDLDVADIAVANKLHVVGEARIPMLVIRMMPPRFTRQPTIGTLIDIESGPLASWASKWHASLPARVLQQDALAPDHAGSSLEKLAASLVAGASLH